VTLVSYLLLIALGGYTVALIEEWSSSGRLRPSAPLLRGLALLVKESITPRRHDPTLFEAAPPHFAKARLLTKMAPSMLQPMEGVLDTSWRRSEVNTASSHNGSASVSAHRSRASNSPSSARSSRSRSRIPSRWASELRAHVVARAQAVVPTVQVGEVNGSVAVLRSAVSSGRL
jgi:hypothetical protein